MKHETPKYFRVKVRGQISDPLLTGKKSFCEEFKKTFNNFFPLMRLETVA